MLGPIGQAWAAWLESRRRAYVARDDADITDLRRQRDYLRGVADERLEEITRRDALIAAHAPWDRERWTAAAAAGHDAAAAAASHPRGGPSPIETKED